MARSDSGKMPLDRHHGNHPVCPVCQGNLARVPRRLSDRFVSIFMLVHRYRCCSMPCNWEGTLRVPYVPGPTPTLARRRATD